MLNFERNIDKLTVNMYGNKNNRSAVCYTLSKKRIFIDIYNADECQKPTFVVDKIADRTIDQLNIGLLVTMKDIDNLLKKYNIKVSANRLRLIRHAKNALILLDDAEEGELWYPFDNKVDFESMRVCKLELVDDYISNSYVEVDKNKLSVLSNDYKFDIYYPNDFRDDIMIYVDRDIVLEKFARTVLGKSKAIYLDIESSQNDILYFFWSL